MPSVLNFICLVNVRILLDGINRQELKMVWMPNYAIKGSIRFANERVPHITLKPIDATWLLWAKRKWYSKHDYDVNNVQEDFHSTIGLRLSNGSTEHFTNYGHCKTAPGILFTNTYWYLLIPNYQDQAYHATTQLTFCSLPSYHHHQQQQQSL